MRIEKLNKDLELKMTATSNATFTSSTSETTINNLLDGGWQITEEDLEMILEGGSVTLYGRHQKITISKK